MDHNNQNQQNENFRYKDDSDNYQEEDFMDQLINSNDFDDFDDFGFFANENESSIYDQFSYEQKKEITENHNDYQSLLKIQENSRQVINPDQFQNFEYTNHSYMQQNQNYSCHYTIKNLRKKSISAQAANKKNAPNDRTGSAFGIYCFLSLKGAAEQFRKDFNRICGKSRIQKKIVRDLHNIICRSIDLRKMSRDEYRSINTYFVHFVNNRAQIIWAIHEFLEKNPEYRNSILHSNKNHF